MKDETPNRDHTTHDDIALFADHWVIVRNDGTPVLNGSPEDLELSLRVLIDRLRGESHAR